MPDPPGPPLHARQRRRAHLVSRLSWLLVGLLVGAAAATFLARRTEVPASAPTVERTPVDQPAPVQGGRHAWDPPGGATGPSAG